MSEATIREKIKTILSGVTNIGVVHDYRRSASSDAAFIELFRTTISGVDQIRGWMISRRSASEQQKTTAAPHQYEIDGYMGLQDAAATEKTFTLLIEAVRAAVRDDMTLFAAGFAHDALQVQTQEELMFGAVLCHHVKLTFAVYDLI